MTFDHYDGYLVTGPGEFLVFFCDMNATDESMNVLSEEARTFIEYLDLPEHTRIHTYEKGRSSIVSIEVIKPTDEQTTLLILMGEREW